MQVSVARNGYTSGGRYDVEGACVQRQVGWVLLPAFLFFSIDRASLCLGFLLKGGACLRNGMRRWRAKCMQGMQAGRLDLWQGVTERVESHLWDNVTHLVWVQIYQTAAMWGVLPIIESGRHHLAYLGHVNWEWPNGRKRRKVSDYVCSRGFPPTGRHIHFCLLVIDSPPSTSGASLPTSPTLSVPSPTPTNPTASHSPASPASA